MLRRRPEPPQADQELAASLDDRVAAAAEAERRLQQVERTGRAAPEELRMLRRELDARLTEAIEAADAAYRIALGPVEGVKRVRVLARAARPEVREADRRRRDLALVRSHNRMASRDDLGVIPPRAFLPGEVGTAARHLATHEGH